MFQKRAGAIEANRQAVADLYETHYEKVVRYVFVRIGNGAQAEDLASEVFVRALRSAHKFEDTGAPMEAWVFKIAHNIVVDHYRKEGRRPGAVPLDNIFSLAGKDDPTEGIERGEDVEELHDAMQQLSEAQRQVLALRFGGEMTSEEAAAVIGKKPGAVREMQSAAIKKLRQVMSERSERGVHGEGRNQTI